MPPLRVLLATYGSTGDLAPLLPVVDALSELGHEPLLTVPRLLGLSLRRDGRDHIVYGHDDGHDARHDDALITTRFGGWESWRRLAADHVAPTVAEAVADVGAALDGWEADVVVTTTFAVAPRIAAHARGLPHVSLSLYPQLRGLGDARGSAFARPLLEAVTAAVPAAEGDRKLRARLAWGDDGGAMLHDPALLAPSTAATEVVGFPYWDEFPHAATTIARADEWLAGRTRPVVLVTLGSFVRRREVIDGILATLHSRDVDALVINAGREEHGKRYLAVGFVPISHVVSRCCAAIHHGGIGTSYGVLRAGIPSIIVPQAFDQPFNAALLERANVGRSTTITELPTTVQSVIDDRALLDTCAHVAASLQPVDAVVARICALVSSAA